MKYENCDEFLLSVEENEEIIRKFLSKHKDFVEEKFVSKLNGNIEKNGITYLPNLSEGAGFYCCKLKKL